jgi:hypothetical protein
VATITPAVVSGLVAGSRAVDGGCRPLGGHAARGSHRHGVSGACGPTQVGMVCFVGDERGRDQGVVIRWWQGWKRPTDPKTGVLLAVMAFVVAALSAANGLIRLTRSESPGWFPWIEAVLWVGIGCMWLWRGHRGRQTH